MSNTWYLDLRGVEKTTLHILRMLRIGENAPYDIRDRRMITCHEGVMVGVSMSRRSLRKLLPSNFPINAMQT